MKEISRQSNEQAAASRKLREYAGVIRKSTTQTNAQIAAQAQQTDRLVNYAKRLTESVGVFQLDEADRKRVASTREVNTNAA